MLFVPKNGWNLKDGFYYDIQWCRPLVNFVIFPNVYMALLKWWIEDVNETTVVQKWPTWTGVNAGNEWQTRFQSIKMNAWLLCWIDIVARSLTFNMASAFCFYQNAAIAGRATWRRREQTVFSRRRPRWAARTALFGRKSPGLWYWERESDVVSTKEVSYRKKLRVADFSSHRIELRTAPSRFDRTNEHRKQRKRHIGSTIGYVDTAPE